MAGRRNLGRAQLELLRYVQERSPVTVRQVAEHLAERRGITRTTVLNVMERLREKGYLTRELIGGIYHYSPLQSRQSLLRDLVRDFVNQALGGSLEPFVAYLAEEAQLTDEELARLQQRVWELRDSAERER